MLPLEGGSLGGDETTAFLPGAQGLLQLELWLALRDKVGLGDGAVSMPGLELRLQIGQATGSSGVA